MASPPTRKLNKRTKLCEVLAKQYVGPEKYYNWGKLWYTEVTNLDIKYQWTKHIIERYGHSTVRGMRSTHLYPEFQRQPLRGYKHHLESLQERTFLMCATPTFSFWSTTPLSPLSHHPSPHLPTSPPPHFSPSPLPTLPSSPNWKEKSLIRGLLPLSISITIVTIISASNFLLLTKILQLLSNVTHAL